MLEDNKIKYEMMQFTSLSKQKLQSSLENYKFSVLH